MIFSFRTDNEELGITTQVIRDGVLARKLHYEEQNPSSRTPDIDTVKQTMCDAVHSRPS